MTSTCATHASVSVIVIVFDDARRLAAAVESALAQGPRVGEVVIVDDASTDETPAVCAKLAAADPRVRVARREHNSGGCGTPRNDGVRAARCDRIAFLDSDDVLPPGAIDALSAAADTHDAHVVAGLCVRRELPHVRDLPWQPQLFTTASVHVDPAERPQTVWDTLSVNKLYDRGFLIANGLRFPDGAACYEDFVFTARVYAAGPRFAVVPEHVYTWHVRRDSGAPSLSLRRDRVANWLDRLDAHRQVVAIFTEAGKPTLRAAAQTKFVEHDLRLYLRELCTRSADYQESWWRTARTYLADLEVEALDASCPAAHWAASVIGAHEAVTGVRRLCELATEPPRLIGPYATRGDTPVWDTSPPEVVLAGLADIAAADLPATIEADVRGPRGGHLVVTVHDLYGRLAVAGPVRLDLELRDRHSDEVRVLGVREGLLRALPRGSAWTTVIAVHGSDLAGSGPFTVWDMWARVHVAAGPPLVTKVRAGAGLGRRVRLDLRHGIAFVQFYSTASHSLAIRHAGGTHGLREIAGARLRRSSRVVPTSAGAARQR
jgi:glycosyltransferase involved in cell wall biosynthesis